MTTCCCEYGPDTIKGMGLDFYEVYLDLEEEFEIRILDDVMSTPAERVGDLFAVILEALRSQRRERFAADSQYEQKAWEHYKAYLCSQLSLRPEQIVRSAYFVRDLKLY